MWRITTAYTTSLLSSSSNPAIVNNERIIITQQNRLSQKSVHITNQREHPVQTAGCSLLCAKNHVRKIARPPLCSHQQPAGSYPAALPALFSCTPGYCMIGYYTRKGGLIPISGNTYGYVRVSTREQSEDRQLIAMEELSIPEKNIFLDRQPGKDFDRPQYKRYSAGAASAIASAKLSQRLSTMEIRKDYRYARSQINKALNTFMDFLEEQGISWINWALSNKDESYSFLAPDCETLSGWTEEQLSPSGQYVISRLHQ